MCKGTNTHDGEKIPKVLKPWIYFYNKTPNLLSINGVGLSFALTSAVYLFIWRMSSLYFLYYLGWPTWPNNMLAQKAVGSAIATIHALHLELPLFMCIITQPFIPSKKMNTSPKWWQQATNALLEFCTGYMMQDTFFVLHRAYAAGEELTTSDISFIGHHVACSIYMTSTRMVGAGHISAMILMFTGEFTNPLQNTHAILEYALQTECCGGATIQLLYEYTEITFAIFYFFFRTVVGPVCASYNVYDLLFTKDGRKNIPVGLSIFWCVASWGVLIGSIPWIVDCYNSILKFTNSQEQEL